MSPAPALATQGIWPQMAYPSAPVGWATIPCPIQGITLGQLRSHWRLLSSSFALGFMREKVWEDA